MKRAPYKPQDLTTRKRRPDWLYFRCVGNLRRHAKQRGLLFELPKPEAVGLLKAACSYCGAPPHLPIRYKQFTALRNTLDRLDSSRGYIPGNCVTACHFCNMAKGEMSRDAFLEHVGRIYQHSVENCIVY